MWEAINKWGSLIADASGNGPNVLSEVGYAMGAKKMVMVMRTEDSPKAVANIHPDWIYIYSIVEGADPPDSTIEQALHWYSAVKSAHEAGISMMDPYTAPGKILDFLDEAAKKKNKTFFRWKGRSEDRDRN